jgi:hypothetical protein
LRSPLFKFSNLNPANPAADPVINLETQLPQLHKLIVNNNSNTEEMRQDMAISILGYLPTQLQED